jgi:hypothetical protein
MEEHPIEGFRHLPVCAPVSYQTNPPSSGDHYSRWAAYRTYDTPIGPGFWVHDLEHGAVVVSYHCPEGCPAEVAAAQALIDALPADCGDSPARRMILVPYPDLSTKFAASAWGFTLRASCFDRDAFAAFVAQHYGHGRESICADGVDPTSAGPGGAALCPEDAP